MFNFIEKVQQKPKSVRRNISLFTTLVIMTPIIFIWISTFSLDLNNQQASVISSTEENSPFDNIKNKFTETYSGAKEQINNIKKANIFGGIEDGLELNNEIINNNN